MAYTRSNPAVLEKIHADQTWSANFGNLGAIPATQQGVATRLDNQTYADQIAGGILQLWNLKWTAAAPLQTLKGKINKSGTYRLGPSDSYQADGNYKAGDLVTTSQVGSTWYKLDNQKFIKKSDVGSAFDSAVFLAIFKENLTKALSYAVGAGGAQPPDIDALLVSARLRLVQLMAGDARIKAMGIGA
jgi:hypothetical protein